MHAGAHIQKVGDGPNCVAPIGFEWLPQWITKASSGGSTAAPTSELLMLLRDVL